jgi:hypothetical protein
MTRALGVLTLSGVAAAFGAQQPLVENGRVEMRAATTIEREIAAAGRGADPAWVAWQAPMVAGDRNLCSTWSDGIWTVRGESLEPRTPGTPPAPIARPPGPVAIERGTSLVILARVAAGALERLRVIADDCPIDAGGRTIHWLTGVAPAESVRYLDSLTRVEPLGVGPNRRHADAAIVAISLHADPAADAALDRLTARTADAHLRRQAASALATGRGASGLARLRALIRDEPDRGQRQHFVAALAASPDAGVPGELLALARTDADAQIRGEAAYRYVRRQGAAGVVEALALVEREADDTVRRRLVSAIGSLPNDAGTPALVTLARTHSNLAVRKEAVAALGRSRDPRARQVIEELLK